MRIHIFFVLCFVSVTNVFAQVTGANLKSFRNLLWSYEHDQVYCQQEFTSEGLRLIKHYFKQPISICDSTERQTPELYAAYQHYLKLAQEDKDDGQAAYFVGMANVYGIGIPTSIEANNHDDLKWLKVAADRDYPPAIVAHIDIDIATKGQQVSEQQSAQQIERLSKKRLEAYHKAALKGLPMGYAYLINYYTYQNNKEQVLYWLSQAEKNHAGNYPLLLALKASIFSDDKYAKQDIPKALNMFIKITENKESGIHTTARALGTLGRFYTIAEYRDPKKILDYYRKAALLNDGFAQNQLANLYYTGTWVKQDYTQANYWYCQAAAHAQRPTHPCKEGNLNSATAEAEQTLME